MPILSADWLQRQPREFQRHGRPRLWLSQVGQTPATYYDAQLAVFTIKTCQVGAGHDDSGLCSTSRFGGCNHPAVCHPLPCEDTRWTEMNPILLRPAHHCQLRVNAAGRWDVVLVGKDRAAPRTSPILALG